MEYKQFGKTGTYVSAIGQGTMGIGGYFTEDTSRDEILIDNLKVGIECGMTFLDTAEAYGAGHSEELVGRAIKNCREQVFVATKVSPENLFHDSVLLSLEGSLRRLRTDYIDLYQIHWPNPIVPLEETMRALDKLLKDGKIRFTGVSNFSFAKLKEANEMFLLNGIDSIQLEYNLFDRTIEDDILSYCEKEGITVIAYSPLDHGRISNGDDKHKILQKIADKYHKTTAQVALRWLVSRPPVIAIPKAVTVDHIKKNASSTDFKLSIGDINLIDRIFAQSVVSIATDRVKVGWDGLDKFVPGPDELAADIRNGEELKPIRVVKSKDTSGKYDYDLVEGKLRYWAWVAAHNGKISIPALVR